MENLGTYAVTSHKPVTGRWWGSLSANEQDHLMMGGCDTVQLAAEYGTPLLVYDELYIRGQIRHFHAALQSVGVKYEVSYASKAFCTLAMCQLAHQEGMTLDVVSGGELYTALAAGVPAEQIRFHGNNKTPMELDYALSAGVGVVIVDNKTEVKVLNERAQQHGKTVQVMLRIAPGVEAHTHEYISTGQQDSKFGFDLQSGQAHDALALVANAEHLICIGLHCHIGSQIFDASGHMAAAERMVHLYRDGLELGLPFRALNLGGGFGIRYTKSDTPVPMEQYLSTLVDSVRSACTELGMTLPELWFEPGRSIVGGAGITLYSVGSEKRIDGVRNYISVDGGMTDNPRLALYGAEYDAVLANRVSVPAEEPWTVAGKCCESGDIILRDTRLPNPQFGDILAVFATGAYNYSMASHYNRIPNPAVLFVKDGRARVVVERETWADLIAHDRTLVD